MATLQQLERALFNAHNAGDSNSARKLAAVVNRERSRLDSRTERETVLGQISELDEEPQVPATVRPPEQPSLISRAVSVPGGAGEAALSLGTGATSGTLGFLGGTLKGLAEQMLAGNFGTPEGVRAIEEEAMRGMEALTYVPRTEAGQDIVGAIGEATAPLAAIAPMAGELSAIGSSARVAGTQARGKLAQRRGIKQDAQFFKDLKEAEIVVAPKEQQTTVIEAKKPRAPYVKKDVDDIPIQEIPLKTDKPYRQQREPEITEIPAREVKPKPSPKPSTKERVIKVVKDDDDDFIIEEAGMSERKADPLDIDRAAREEFPMKETLGQKFRDFEQLRFERETAKLPEGKPFRDRYNEQNMMFQQHLDKVIDETGAKLTDLKTSEMLMGIGESVVTSLQKRADKDSKRVNVLYKQAEKQGEMENLVKLNGLASHLNENKPEGALAKIIPVIAGKGKLVGAFYELDNGKLVANSIPIKTAELLRKTINNSIDNEKPNIRQGAIMKDLIDIATEGEGGNLYKKARAARTQYAKDYENIILVKQLLGTKRGSSDRSIALEDVLKKSILQPLSSLDTVKTLNKLLVSQGKEGKQGWNELKGGTLRYIKDEALKNVTTDEAGKRIVSASQLDRVITQLDKSGKLDFVLGKELAGKMRTLNKIAKEVLTVPPGVLNTSNTASVLAGLMDIVISGTSGVPAPAMSLGLFLKNTVKDKKLQKRIQNALGDKNGE